VRLSRKLATLRTLSWRDRGLVAEAAVLLTVARAVLRVVPFRRYRRWLSFTTDTDTFDAARASRVIRAVNVASHNVPFVAACLPRAMAAKVMLARRGIASTLIVGAGHDDRREMLLHAWLEAGGRVVVGDAGRSAVTPVVRFS
jgi:Transglutaminase-like superfamily